MPKTAYSKHFRRELDVEQLLALMRNGAAPQMEQDFAHLPQEWRDWIKGDIVCPSCGNSDAQIVSLSRSKRSAAALRQAHFRFVAPDEEDAHHRFCEFYRADDGIQQNESLVNFSSAKSDETRVVRELVCKGIEQGVFDQATVRSMRQWFFDMKAGSRFVVTTSEEALEWLMCLRRHYHQGLPFHPGHAEMPDYDWKEAALSQFTEENQTLLALVRQPPFGEAERRRAIGLIQKYRSREMFDVSALEPFYKQTIALCVFVGRNYQNLKYSPARINKMNWGEAPAALLAFSALLLFTSQWDMNQAILKLARLVKASPPSDLKLGNVIGLNPFHDYWSWQYIMLASRVSTESRNGMDYQEQLTNIMTRLKDEYSVWKRNQT